MKLLPPLLILMLTACDGGLKLSDYRGGFATQAGDCVEVGDVGINYENKQIEVGFYCFLKNCAKMSGVTSQGGFFHLENKSGHYIQGRMGPDEGKGTWFLNMKGKNCSGHWAALKN